MAITIIATLYQLGPAKLVHDSFGDWTHYALEVLFYGTAGTVVTWFTLRLVRRWVEQKEQAEAEVYRLSAELQQRVDERTCELRQKNEALSAANRQLQELDRLKSEFVSLVSHELRAPLTNLGGDLVLDMPTTMEDGSAVVRIPAIGAAILRITASYEGGGGLAYCGGFERNLCARGADGASARRFVRSGLTPSVSPGPAGRSWRYLGDV